MTSQPTLITVSGTGETKYVPRLPFFQTGDNLLVFLSRFSDSMLASKIVQSQ